MLQTVFFVSQPQKRFFRTSIFSDLRLHTAADILDPQKITPFHSEVVAVVTPKQSPLGQIKGRTHRKQSDTFADGSAHEASNEGLAVRRRQRQQRPPLSPQQLGSALLSSSIGVAVTNSEGRFLVANDVLCRMTGYTKEELLKKDWLSIGHPDCAKESNALTWRIEAYKIPGFSTEKKCVRKDGREVWFRSSLSQVHQRKKLPPLYVALVEEITDRKLAEKALAAKELELREAQRLAGVGNWQFDLRTDSVTWSEELYRVFDLDPKLPAPTFQEHSKVLSSESWNLLRVSVEKTLRTGVPYEIELEVIRPDGSRAWIVARGEAVRDAAGNVVRLRGTAQDITSRKRAEEALRKSEEKFILAFNAVPVAVAVVTAAEGRQIEVNDALLRITGYKREEVIGRTHSELGYWNDSGDREEMLQRLLNGESLRNVECRFRRRNGEPFTGLLSADLIEFDGQQCVVSAAMDVSELRNAEQAVRSLSSKLALHFQQTMFGVIELDPEFRVNEWNPAAEAIFGYSRHEAVGRDVRDLILPADIRDPVSQVVSTAMCERRGRYVTNRNITKDGREIICEWFNTPLVQEDGTVAGVMALGRDITAEKRAREDLAASEATLCAMFQSTDDSIWTVDAERFGLMTFNSAASEGFAKRCGGKLQAGMEPEDLLPPDLAEWWRERYRQALSDGSFETDYVGVDNTAVHHLSFNRLVRNDQPFGVSVFARDVTKRRQAERELHASEERYRHLVASSSDWVWEVDDQVHYTYASPQCRDILGYDPEEIVGKTPFELMPEQEAERVGSLFRKISAERKPFRALENVNIHKNGYPVVIETNGFPIINSEGHFCGYRGTDRDITERKNAEMVLQESEAKYRSLAENLPGVVFQFYAKNNGEMGFYFIHHNSRDVVGIDADPIDTWGERLAACLDAEDFRRGMLSIRQAVTSAGNWDFETKLRKPTGEEVYIRGVSRPERHADELRYHGILLDVTARKLAERALRESEERLRLAAEASRMYAFEWNPTTDIVSRSAECAEILAIPDGAMQMTGQQYIARIDPADRERYTSAVAGLTPDNPSFHLAYRFLRLDGAAVWLEDHARALFDSNGSLVRTIGMTADVTARKESEEALRESEARLRLALESGRMYAFEWDFRTDTMTRSSEYTAVFGTAYPQVETGSEFLTRLHSEDCLRYMDVLSHLTPSQDSYHTRYRKMLLNGRMCWIEARGRGFFDADGRLARVLGVAADVTALKESEDALRALSACLINAQEDERKRVARELHDGVSQELALVSIQMSRASITAKDADLRSKLDEMCEKLQSVLSDIAHLSHELHPSTLKHLGLPAAIRVLCEDVTNTHGIDVKFADVNSPEPPSKDTALCFYRIVQEALRNIIKHGRCKQAWVELRGNQNEISLHVRDQGVGFDISSAKAGLGLISMRERVRLIGGRFVITSEPGAGTSIDAYALLEPQESERAA